MALVIADRVKETTTTSGTGTVSLAGAASGFRTFVAGVGNGNTTYYALVDGTAWEVGVGTVTDGSPDTLSRDTILSSSTGSAINLSGGTVDVFCTIPGDRAQSTWDRIAAAAGDGSTDNGDNNIAYRVAKTTNSEISWRFTESAAATNGTSTSGVPNQVLLQLDTVASSTMSPLKVLSRGSFVFAVSPTTAQLLFPAGSGGAPPIGFTTETNTGFYLAGTNILAVRVAGTDAAWFQTNRFKIAPGSAATPSLSSYDFGSDGLFLASGVVGISIAGVENSRFGDRLIQVSRGSADTTSFALNARKARGSVASPSAITTGDDLLTISGYGYVGATGTYVEAARIKFDSTGTIANTTSGVGGIVRIEAAAVGAVGPSEIARFTRATTTGGGWMTMDEADANPGTGDLAADEEVAVYRKADKLVFAYNLAGVMNYLTIPLDGSSTAWTNGTTAP